VNKALQSTSDDRTLNRIPSAGRQAARSADMCWAHPVAVVDGMAQARGTVDLPSLLPFIMTHDSTGR
jgi:hypothetical protein